MRSLELDEPRSVWAEGAVACAEFCTATWAVARAEMRKLARDPTEVFTRSVQPVLWLLVFGQIFTRTRAIPTGGLSYLAFMTPGILAQSVLFTAIFYGIAVIWERDLGIAHKLLVSPAFRSALVLGKAVTAGLRGLIQAVVVIAVAALMGVELRTAPLAVLGVAVEVFLGGALFATFSLIVACLVKTRERFMGIGQVLTMPLFFASNAIYPLDIMPAWIRAVARANPLSYLVDALRTLMIAGGHSAFGLGLDFLVQAAVLLALLTVASRLYPKLVL
ncbi:MAG: ABC transporter permease [Myxococcaceae bacterium]